ncbi:hypothetical protein GLOIN_2v1479067 [Rhizophagus clarus]|uniref:Uncharacterized protein n=1 Tax=Rhizophagus clarus TaxID=94130 RepID=A0A8H3QYW8_9GLOM|nr:hypothetical protein GLOIN_2v1479067 [Rhizophagus clarus]
MKNHKEYIEKFSLDAIIDEIIDVTVTEDIEKFAVVEKLLVVVFNHHLEEWSCEDCKYIIKSSWMPKDLFNRCCNFYEQKDIIFDYESQSKVWKCRECQCDIKI